MDTYNDIMKKLIVIIALLLTPTLYAKSNSIGFLLGNPTAIVGQTVLSETSSYQAGLAFSYDDSILIYADRLYHYPGAFKTTEDFINQLTPYIGVGAALAITTEDRRSKNGYFDKDEGSLGLGVRVPLGIEWKNDNPALGIYFEIAPGISIFPETSAAFMGGLGFRYFFN